MHLKEEMVSVPWAPGVARGGFVTVRRLRRCCLAVPRVLSSRVCPGSLVPKALELCAEPWPGTGSRPVRSQGNYFVPGPRLPRESLLRPAPPHTQQRGQVGDAESRLWCLSLQICLGCFRFFLSSPFSIIFFLVLQLKRTGLWL